MAALSTSRLSSPARTIERMSQSRDAAGSRKGEGSTPHVEEGGTVFDGPSLPSANEDAEVVRRALSGDSEALSMLFDLHRVRLYRTSLSLLHNREDAEDALQDGLLSAYVKLKSFEGRARFSTWLTRVVLN